MVYVTPDQALKRFRAQLQSQNRPDLTVYLDKNPLLGSLEVKLKDARSSERGRRAPGNRPCQGVKEIQKVVDALLTVTNVLRTAGLILLVLVGLTVCSSS